MLLGMNRHSLRQLLLWAESGEGELSLEPFLGGLREGDQG